MCSKTFCKAIIYIYIYLENYVYINNSIKDKYGNKEYKNTTRTKFPYFINFTNGSQINGKVSNYPKRQKGIRIKKQEYIIHSYFLCSIYRI